jgi:hypothetical protein
VKSDRTSGFESRPSRQMAGFPTRLLSVSHFRRVAGLGYRSSRRGRRFESGLRNQMPE